MHSDSEHVPGTGSGPALVRANPDGFADLARRPGIAGKTWSHPVLAGDLLLVRNAEEMAAFRLPAAPERAPRRAPDTARGCYLLAAVNSFAERR